MKKYSWIVALLLALSLAFVFVGCGGGGGGGGEEEEEEDLEWKVIFDLQDAAAGTVTHKIQEQTVGAITFPASGETPITPLVKAGDMPAHISSFEIADNGGKKALKYVTVADWGPGFDMPNSVFGFRAGDKIKITGKAESSKAIDLALNVNQGGAQAIAGNQITEAGEFTIEAELSAADISKIRANEQKVIRFEDRKGAATVTITQIRIEGNRPSNIKTLDAPVISITGTTVSWAAISGAGGYQIFALAEDGDEAEEVAEVTADKTSYDFSASTLAAGKYSITVVAVGVAGSTKDSAASNAVSYTHVVATLTLKRTILDDDADWNYKADDAMNNPDGLSLKGNISETTTIAILAITGGEARIYWTYVGSGTGTTANNGIGSFAGVNYNSGTGGASGIAIIKIAAFDLDSQPSYVPGGCIALNTYNDCAVEKIEIWGP